MQKQGAVRFPPMGGEGRGLMKRIRALPSAGLSAYTPTGLSHRPVSASIPNAK